MPTPAPTAAPVGPTHEPHRFSTPQQIYLWLATFSAACLIIADIVGVKLFQIPLPYSFTLPVVGEISSITHTCGMLTFPVTFLITDTVNEFYGKRAARRLILLGFSMALFVFLVINIAQAMPAWDVPFNVTQSSFDSIFGSAKIMYIASLIAYVVGNLADISLFGIIKKLTGGKMIWLRSTGSTVISQFIDSFFVRWIAFYIGRRMFPGGGTPMSMPEVLKTACTGYTLKFVIAIALTPVIYACHALLKRSFGLTPIRPDAN